MSQAEANDSLEDERRGAYVTAFSRGLSVIRSFSESSASLTIADIARATGLNRATARRFLHTLEADGYVSSDGVRYSLRPRVLDLGYAYLSSISITDIFQQHLVELADRLHESCSAGVLEEDEVVFVARARTSHPRLMTLAISVGSRLPAHLSAIGRVLLGELPEDDLEQILSQIELRKETEHTISDSNALKKEIRSVHARGYCVIDQEVELGVIAAAVPVRRPNQPTVGISVALHTSRASVESLRAEYIPALQESATELERVMRFRH